MREDLNENCLNHLGQLVLGAAVVGAAALASPVAVPAAVGLATAIGAGQLMATGFTGLTAIAAARAIQGRASEDAKARAACEAVQKRTAKMWMNSGGENAQAAKIVADVFNKGFSKLDFPITDLQNIAAHAGQEDGLYISLATQMLAQLDDPFGHLLADPHRAIALDCLVQAVRAGILASDVLLNETLLLLTDTNVRVGRETQDEVKQARAQIAALTDTVTRLVAEIRAMSISKEADKAKIPEEVIIGLARRIAADITNIDQALRELERAVGIAIEIQRDGTRGSNAGDQVDLVLAKMAELSLRGENDAAAQIADDAYANWQKSEAERQKSAKQQGYALLEAGIKQDILRRDFASVARREREKVFLMHGDQETQFEALRGVQDSYFTRGEALGLNLDLEISIHLAQLVRAFAQGNNQIGNALNDLGVSLWELGRRENGTKRLEEAVDTYRQALLVYTKDRAAIEWAKIHYNLGNAFAALGEREIGTTSLKEAECAYREALKEWTRKCAPLKWAQTQNALGYVLYVRGKGEAGTARLTKAVNAHRKALRCYLKERVTVHLAVVYNNLGIALTELGQRKGGTRRLRKAEDAYRKALLEQTGSQLTLSWAMIQHNLGNVLTVLGERAGGTAELAEAVNAYDQALIVYSRVQVPLNLAKTTASKANAQRIIAERTSDCSLAQSAMADLTSAIDVLDAVGAEGDLPFCRRALLKAQRAVELVCVDNGP
jgi:tetratricopeptide (TPR) repeat protein